MNNGIYSNILSQVSLTDKKAFVTFDPKHINQSTLRETIYDMGFDASISGTESSREIGVLSIKGMTFQSCSRSITERISELSGVEKMAVSLEKNQGIVLFDKTMTSAENIAQEIDSMGFETAIVGGPMMSQSDRKESVLIQVEGMTCGSCVKSIESHVGSLPGVRTISVSLEKKEAVITYDHSVTSPTELRDAIYDMGFDAKLPGQTVNVNNGMALAMVIVGIEGMTCNSCVRSIEDKVGSLQGVKSIKVSLQDKIADVKYDSTQLKAEDIRMAIYEMGFDATLPESFDDNHHDNHQTAVLRVEGMTCNSCVKSIEGTISDHPGVISIQVSLENKSASVTFDPKETTLLAIRDAIYDMGFECFMPESGGERTETVTLNIKGMTCNSCVRSIEDKLSENHHVTSVIVSLANENAIVTFDPGQIIPSHLRDIVYDMGFDVTIPGEKKKVCL